MGRESAHVKVTQICILSFNIEREIPQSVVKKTITSIQVIVLIIYITFY